MRCSTYDEWGVAWFTGDKALHNLHGLANGKMLRTMGKTNKMICRIWDGIYPDGKNCAKIPSGKIFGPVTELRTVSIGRKMYINGLVPSIDSLQPEFRYVSIAFYDPDVQKLTECCRVVPDAPPEEEGFWPADETWTEGEWSNWQDPPPSQGARETPAPGPVPPAAPTEWRPLQTKFGTTQVPVLSGPPPLVEVPRGYV